jgi:hypothetical protein
LPGQQIHPDVSAKCINHNALISRRRHADHLKPDFFLSQ